MAEIRATFDDPIRAKQARVALEALAAPSLSISSRSESSGTTTTVSVGDGKKGGFMSALGGMFGGGSGKGATSVGAGSSFGVSKSVGKSWSFGLGRSEDDGVLHETFSGTHRETMTVRIDDAYADSARQALRANGGTISA